MKPEAFGLLMVGAAVFAVVCVASRGIRSPKFRALALALSFGFTLGLGVVPGHGEFVVAPVLAFLRKGGMVAAAGVVYGLLWCVAFLWFARALAKRR